MLKGASRAVLKIVERGDASRPGAAAMRRARAKSLDAAVPAILSARFGPEVLEMVGGTVKFVPHDRLAEIIVLAATCPDLARPSARASCRGRVGDAKRRDEAAIGTPRPRSPEASPGSTYEARSPGPLRVDNGP